MEQVAEVTLNPGDILYREGDRNDCGYIIESGSLILYNGTGEDRVVCETRGPAPSLESFLS